MSNQVPTITKRAISVAAYLNRNLRYGKSRNRILQYVVIRSRFYLKQYLLSKKKLLDLLGKELVSLKLAGKMELYLNEYVDRWLYECADSEPHVVRMFV